MVTGGGGGGGGVGSTSVKLFFFYFLYVEWQKQSFQPIFFDWYLSNETAFVDKSRVEPTICFIKKISFSLKLFTGHFYGQSFIKTVRGPLCRSSKRPIYLVLYYF